MPFNAAPDEEPRYLIPKFIFQHGYLPNGYDPEIRINIWGFSYAFTPITGYFPCVLLMKIMSIFSTSEQALYFAARMSSVLFSTGTVYLCAKIGKKLFDDRIAKIFVVIIGLFPQFAFISSYVNLDAFGFFTVALIIYLMIRAEEKKWSIKYCIFLGLGVGLCVQSYYNCYGIIVVAGIYAIISVAGNKEFDTKKKFRIIISRILIIAGVALAISGWWFVRNAILYDGDFMGMKASQICGEQYADYYYKPSHRKTPANLGYSLFHVLFTMGWIETSAKTFIACFGYLNIFLNEIWYIVMYVVAAAGLVLNFIKGKTQIKTVRNKKTFLWMMVLMMFITICLSLYYTYFTDYQAQGRYLMPMLFSLQILILSGYAKLMSKIGEYAKKIVSIVLLGLYLILFCYSFVVIEMQTYLN